MQLLIDAARWLGLGLVVVVALGLVVVATLAWFLNHPDAS